MKDYKRLTFDCWKYDEFLKQDETYARLAELEDKIESGELVNITELMVAETTRDLTEKEIEFFIKHNEEVRKETAKNILTGLYELTQRHYGNKYLLSSRDVIDIAERYDIDLFGKPNKSKISTSWRMENEYNKNRLRKLLVLQERTMCLRM